MIPSYHIILIKSPNFGQTFYKNEVINARVYWTDDITEHFITEHFVKDCLRKIQTIF